MMPRYDLVLLDADGTLLDFVRAQEYALTNMLAEFDISIGDDVLPIYDSINAGYWERLERGEVTKSQLVVNRFEDLLRHLNSPGDPTTMNARFLHHLSEADFMLDGALELCAALAPHCMLAIATNGIVVTQTRRLQKSPLAPYISHLIVSEAAGAAKPDKLFFEHAFVTCGFSHRSRALMVGDSLSADMRGGAEYGIDTCWYNPSGLPPVEGFSITYTIDDLRKLIPIVLG